MNEIEKFGQECFQAGRKEAFEEAAEVAAKCSGIASLAITKYASAAEAKKCP